MFAALAEDCDTAFKPGDISIGNRRSGHCGQADCATGGCLPTNCPVLHEAGTVKLFAKGDLIFWDGDRNDRVFIILSGVVRGSKLFSDGRRQICRFAFPGELIDYTRGPDMAFTAEAITPVRALVVSRDTIENAVKSTTCIADLMMRVVLDELNAAREQLLLLGRLSAPERVKSFLETLAKHMGTDDNGAFTAPMSRQDMADYLGLTIETVSRVISQMKRQGKLRLLSTNRMVLVNDHLDDDAQHHVTHSDANVFTTAV